ncbi:hypothetical protein BRO54_3539 [Geobacillus proteiniphilus]|uniref:Uncharacterized protein n=1 Tax=Geobacillus proteiniphilus TaxID=860353 RepID=A0A1Q5SLC2_9BACL|nr:hypothetical protein BRO54_3539 [Geobacillus proteiniphilus]
MWLLLLPPLYIPGFFRFIFTIHNKKPAANGDQRAKESGPPLAAALKSAPSKSGPANRS